MWTLNEWDAELSIGPLHGRIDLTHIERGVSAIELGGQHWPQARLLSVQLPQRIDEQPLAPQESYVRGSDLVATFPPLPPHTVQPQIYWRVRQLAALSAVGIELILSVQTSHLYSEPQTLISSTVPGAEGALIWAPGDQPGVLAPTSLPRSLSAARREEGIVACGIPGTHYVYVETIHPGDLDVMQIEACDGSVRILAKIFAEPLEKGVIRRARVSGWFVPAADWQRRVRTLLESFRQEQPPLTA